MLSEAEEQEKFNKKQYTKSFRPTQCFWERKNRKNSIRYNTGNISSTGNAFKKQYDKIQGECCRKS